MIFRRSLLVFLVLVGFGSLPAKATSQALDCLDWRMLADVDFSIHRASMENLDPCVSYEPFEASGVTWRLVRMQRGPMIPASAPLAVVLHDNEDAAFLGALSLLARFDLQIVLLDTDEERLWDGMDPNRLFIRKGAEITACPYKDRLDLRFAEAILRDWSGRHPIVSFHSNADGHMDDEKGGRGTISIDRLTPPKKAFLGDPTVATPRMLDEDNLIFITGPKFEPSDRQERTIKALNAEGLSVFYNPVNPRNQDCSLSDFLTLAGLSDLYFNVEVEEGDFATAMDMSRRLMSVLVAGVL